MEVPAFSITLKPNPELPEQSVEPGVVVAVIELEPRVTGLCHHSPLSPSKKPGFPPTEKQVCLRLEILLKELTHILQAVTSCEETSDPQAKGKAWERDGSCVFSRSASDAASSLEEGRGPEKLSKGLENNLTEKEKHPKKQDKAWKSRNPKEAKHGSVKLSASDSGPMKVHREAQASKTKVRPRPASDRESKNCVMPNTDQLLQEVEQWCVQHRELTELIKSCQKAQEIPAPPQQESAKLEDEVKKLKHETYSLNLFATLLDNECRILQQRIELFRELKHHHRHGREEKPAPKSPERHKNEESPSESEKKEAEKKEPSSQKLHDSRGAYQKREKVCTSLDFCCNRKNCNNRLNLRIARKVLWGRKKHPCSPK